MLPSQGGSSRQQLIPPFPIVLDPAPWLELEFWDSLAEAFLRYYDKTIMLQVELNNLVVRAISSESLEVYQKRTQKCRRER